MLNRAIESTDLDNSLTKVDRRCFNWSDPSLKAGR